MYQRAPEGHENRTYKFLYDSAKLIVNTDRCKTNRDRRQTTEYDFVPEPSRGRTSERKKIDTHKNAADKHDKKIKQPEKSAEPSLRDRTNPTQIERHFADSPF